MGNDSLLAFFEIPKGKKPAGNRNAIGAMLHCAFVVTAERFRAVEARLKSHGIDYIGPIAQLPGLLGICFYDPNGIRLGFACQPEDGEAPEVIPCVTQSKAEARDELAPSRPGEFHPEPLTDPDLILSHHPARATVRRLPPSVTCQVPPVAG